MKGLCTRGERTEDGVWHVWGRHSLGEGNNMGEICKGVDCPGKRTWSETRKRARYP